MKYSGIKYLTPVLILVLYSCKKSNVQGGGNVTLHVSEFKTNLPIAGAKISLYTQGAFDFWTCGCYVADLLLTGQTDSKGDFTVSQDNFNKANMGIEIEKNLYIPGGGENNTTQFTLCAIETIRLRLLEVNPHPELTYLAMNIKGETQSQYLVYNSENIWPKGTIDTTLTLNVYGEQLNTFTMLINDSSFNTVDTLGPFKIFVSRTDSSNVKEIDF
jgi:hypothetical protein